MVWSQISFLFTKKIVKEEEEDRNSFFFLSPPHPLPTTLAPTQLQPPRPP